MATKSTIRDNIVQGILSRIDTPRRGGRTIISERLRGENPNHPQRYSRLFAISFVNVQYWPGELRRYAWPIQ